MAAQEWPAISLDRYYIGVPVAVVLNITGSLVVQHQGV